VVSKFAFKDLASKFQARVYKPRHVICSTAHFADRIIFLTKGSVRIGDSGGEWAFGECIGYTCLVPHRWAQTCITNEIVEVLELPLLEYEAFLRKHSVYDKILQLTYALLFPRASREEDVSEALEHIKNLKTPTMYPISLGYRINPHEFNFGLTPANEKGAVTAASGELRDLRLLHGVGKQTAEPRSRQMRDAVYSNFRSHSCEPILQGGGMTTDRYTLKTRAKEALQSPEKLQDFMKEGRKQPVAHTTTTLPLLQGSGSRKIKGTGFPSWTKGGLVIMKRTMT